METFLPFLNTITNETQKARVTEVLAFVLKTFPSLKPIIAWNQPMFTHQGTFIIGFSVAKQHLAFAPEQVALEQFSNQIAAAGYSQSKNIVRMPWELPVNYDLLKNIIAFNITLKKDCVTFWAK